MAGKYGCFSSAVAIFIAVPSLLMGLLAAGLIFAGDSPARGFGVFLGALAAVGLGIAVRRLRQAKEHPPVKGKPIHTPIDGAAYEQFRWGNPPPTKKQFGYAISLGVELQHGMTKDSISRAIGDLKPATADQLEMIANLHGKLPRKISETEADDVIAFLSDHDYACPFCGEMILAGNASECCMMCGNSLKKVRIPIQLPKR